MLKLTQRERFLSRKIACSLLMAGTISACISGGDVWAFETVKLTQDTIYNDISEIPTAIEMNGHDVISHDMFGNGSADRSITGTGVETLQIIDADSSLSCAIGAFHDEDCRIVLSNIKNIDITGSWNKDVHSVQYILTKRVRLQSMLSALLVSVAIMQVMSRLCIQWAAIFISMPTVYL